jgi:hypothetical protein
MELLHPDREAEQMVIGVVRARPLHPWSVANQTSAQHR